MFCLDGEVLSTPFMKIIVLWSLHGVLKSRAEGRKNVGKGKCEVEEDETEMQSSTSTWEHVELGLGLLGITSSKWVDADK